MKELQTGLPKPKVLGWLVSAALAVVVGVIEPLVLPLVKTKLGLAVT